ncbi:MAG: hypothetical protein SFU99_14310, partial [Saprospiraceae bacterium]|nr:hypothetical protein [Saprospiraceae bacterium]
MNLDNKYKQKLEAAREKITKKKRQCLFPKCKEEAINSHVLQRQGILNAIIDETNHFYVIEYHSIKTFSFFPSEHLIKKFGIKKGYSFPGFCKTHDREIFKPIETHPIDLNNKRNLGLFSYRTICLELWKKQVYLEFVTEAFSIAKDLEPDKLCYFDDSKAKRAICDFEFYKKEFERELFSKKDSIFEFYAIELPEKKICFSSPLNIHDSENPMTWETDKYGYENKQPLATSVINFFPYQGRSYFIAAMHSKYKCRWTLNLLNKLKVKDNNVVDKIISDILTFRLEFWGMAP